MSSIALPSKDHYAAIIPRKTSHRLPDSDVFGYLKLLRAGNHTAWVCGSVARNAVAGKINVATDLDLVTTQTAHNIFAITDSYYSNVIPHKCEFLGKENLYQVIVPGMALNCQRKIDITLLSAFDPVIDILGRDFICNTCFADSDGSVWANDFALRDIKAGELNPVQFLLCYVGQINLATAKDQALLAIKNDLVKFFRALILVTQKGYHFSTEYAAVIEKLLSEREELAKLWGEFDLGRRNSIWEKCFNVESPLGFINYLVDQKLLGTFFPGLAQVDISAVQTKLKALDGSPQLAFGMKVNYVYAILVSALMATDSRLTPEEIMKKWGLMLDRRTHTILTSFTKAFAETNTKSPVLPSISSSSSSSSSSSFSPSSTSSASSSTAPVALPETPPSSPPSLKVSPFSSLVCSPLTGSPQSLSPRSGSSESSNEVVNDLLSTKAQSVSPIVALLNSKEAREEVLLDANTYKKTIELNIDDNSTGVLTQISDTDKVTSLWMPRRTFLVEMIKGGLPLIYEYNKNLMLIVSPAVLKAHNRHGCTSLVFSPGEYLCVSLAEFVTVLELSKDRVAAAKKFIEKSEQVLPAASSATTKVNVESQPVVVTTSQKEKSKPAPEMLFQSSPQSDCFKIGADKFPIANVKWSEELGPLFSRFSICYEQNDGVGTVRLVAAVDIPKDKIVKLTKPKVLDQLVGLFAPDSNEGQELTTKDQKLTTGVLNLSKSGDLLVRKEISKGQLISLKSSSQYHPPKINPVFCGLPEKIDVLFSLDQAKVAAIENSYKKIPDFVRKYSEGNLGISLSIPADKLITALKNGNDYYCGIHNEKIILIIPHNVLKYTLMYDHLLNSVITISSSQFALISGEDFYKILSQQRITDGWLFCTTGLDIRKSALAQIIREQQVGATNSQLLILQLNRIFSALFTQGAFWQIIGSGNNLRVTLVSTPTLTVAMANFLNQQLQFDFATIANSSTIVLPNIPARLLQKIPQLGSELMDKLSKSLIQIDKSLPVAVVTSNAIPDVTANEHSDGYFQLPPCYSTKSKIIMTVLYALLTGLLIALDRYNAPPGQDMSFTNRRHLFGGVFIFLALGCWIQRAEMFNDAPKQPLYVADLSKGPNS